MNTIKLWYYLINRRNQKKGTTMVRNFNIADFLKKFDSNYDFIYDANRHGKEVAGQREAADAFDDFVKQHGDFVLKFVNYRGDFISSDREAAAFMFTLDDFC